MGSEMCIRDSNEGGRHGRASAPLDSNIAFGSGSANYSFKGSTRLTFRLTDSSFLCSFHSLLLKGAYGAVNGGFLES